MLCRRRHNIRFTRNALAKVSKGHVEMVAATIRTVFAQATGSKVREQPDTVAGLLGVEFPTVAALLLDAYADLTEFADFPQRQWQEIWSTSPLERLNREVKRPTDVVGIFPTTDRLLRLSACVLIEAHDEWQNGIVTSLAEQHATSYSTPGDAFGGIPLKETYLEDERHVGRADQGSALQFRLGPDQRDGLIRYGT